MPAGFFPESQLLGSGVSTSTIPKCGACGLYKTCHSPKMPPSGKGQRRVLIVGEAPGASEDEQNLQFVGESGRLLKEILTGLQVDLTRDCVRTNAVICRPPDNATPSTNQIHHCHPNLLHTIEKYQPHVIIPLGGPATHSVLRGHWRDNNDVTVGKWVGWQIPLQKTNTWICPTYHPAFVLREKSPVAKILFRRHLEAAFALRGRPWKEVPNYEAQVEVLVDDDKATRAIQELANSDSTLTAFDYETNCLKPDSQQAQIVSAAICLQGERTVAFLWSPKVKRAFASYLHGPHKKIGANIKFETRWTFKEYGHVPRHWVWDTMVDGHLLDNRPDITSVKFQAFVLLGHGVYDNHIKPLLKAKRGKTTNRIFEEIDVHQLLLYNGLDAVVEYELARAQTTAANHPLALEF